MDAARDDDGVAPLDPNSLEARLQRVIAAVREPGPPAPPPMITSSPAPGTSAVALQGLLCEAIREAARLLGEAKSVRDEAAHAAQLELATARELSAQLLRGDGLSAARPALPALALSQLQAGPAEVVPEPALDTGRAGPPFQWLGVTTPAQRDRASHLSLRLTPYDQAG